MYYPHVSGGGRTATLCDTTDGQDDCSKLTSGKISVCSHGVDGAGKDGHDINPLTRCTVTVLDHFTSSFHWAETNFSAIWLRPQWYLVDNLVLTDVQDGGISFITSGTYDRSAAIDGDWAVMRTSVLIGHTQAQAVNKDDKTVNPYAADAGPFMSIVGGALARPCENGTPPIQACMSKNEGVSYPLSNFGTGARLFSIYDGPAYQESNIYLDISQSPCNYPDGGCMYAKTPGVRKNATPKTADYSCYLPNAAIGWKQPNGFYYPPSFHSNNLFFDNVDIRHYVIDAPFAAGTYFENATVKESEYCKPVGDATYAIFFQNFTDIDRQTELNDDDGTLTGLTNKYTPPAVQPPPLPGIGTISVNPADFFNAPIETAECLSNIGVTPDKACPLAATPTPATAKTSPFDYVTTVVFPQCAVGPGSGDGRCGSSKTTDEDPKGSGRFKTQFGRGGTWSQECTNPACYGVPLYRQLLTGDTTSGEWKTWTGNACGTAAPTGDCRFPFVRMGGQSTYQHSTLTVDHGVYFMDTTVKQPTQQTGEKFSPVTECSVTPTGICAPRSVNVFQAGQTYYVYFLFAKTSTKQTYQIYVGRGFQTSTIQAVRTDLTVMPVQKFTPITWPTAWGKSYTDPGHDCTVAGGAKPGDGCGILTITIDMTNQTDLLPISSTAVSPGLCKPEKFCKASGTTCGCALPSTDPLFTQCTKACGQWAVKDVDFPDAGAYGFSFTLPPSSGFSTDDNGAFHRPTPTTFAAQTVEKNFNWLATLLLDNSTVPTNGAACLYTKVPGTPSCK
jgi:hypothetical protein